MKVGSLLITRTGFLLSARYCLFLRLHHKSLGVRRFMRMMPAAAALTTLVAGSWCFQMSSGFSGLDSLFYV